MLENGWPTPLPPSSNVIKVQPLSSGDSSVAFLTVVTAKCLNSKLQKKLLMNPQRCLTASPLRGSRGVHNKTIFFIYKRYIVILITVFSALQLDNILLLRIIPTRTEYNDNLRQINRTQNFLAILILFHQKSITILFQKLLVSYWRKHLEKKSMITYNRSMLCVGIQEYSIFCQINCLINVGKLHKLQLFGLMLPSVFLSINFP